MERLKLIASVLAAVFLLLFVHRILSDTQTLTGSVPAAREETVMTAAPSPEATTTAAPGETPSARKIAVNHDGVIEEMDVNEYLICVVAGEVSPLYAPEALKAQAVAARTYLYYKMNGGGCANGGDICTASAHCQAFKSEDTMRSQWGEKYDAYHASIKQAVRETADEVVLFEDKPICAMYHSSSVGRTEDCVSVFGGERPYLVSVDSPLDSSDSEFERTVSIPTEDFLRKVNEAFSLSLKTPAIRIQSYTAAGRASTVLLGETTVKATRLRTALGLRSTDFTVEITADAVVFTMRGYGHGVGMSQHGAQAMAQDGATYREILTHYYTGTRVGIYIP